MRVLLCTAPADQARALARSLVERRLVACVNVIPGLTSVYRWEGEVHEDPEVLLVMKTTEEGAARVLAELPDLHPYDVPEILALPVDAGHPPYLEWVAGQVAG